MIDFLAKLISGNGVTTILFVVVLYLALLWLLFSFWVYTDAKKRYKRTVIAVFYFFVVLVFSFPALVFYLITRPEDDNDFYIMPSDNLSNRGVNVPIVNFIGKDGKVNFSFELKINNQEMFTANSDMTVDVNWKSENPEFKKEEEKTAEIKVEAKGTQLEVTQTVNKDTKTKLKDHAYSSFSNVKAKVSNFKPKFNLPKKAKDEKKVGNS